MIRYYNLEGRNDLLRVLDILEGFKCLTGLALNKNKSKLLILGYYKAHLPDIASSGLTFNTRITTFLGVQFSVHLKDIF